MGAANTTGGVMGKMIDAQSIVVSSSATHQQGNEAAIFKAVFWHSIVLASLVGLIVMFYAYVMPSCDSVKEGSSMTRTRILIGTFAALLVSTMARGAGAQRATWTRTSQRRGPRRGRTTAPRSSISAWPAAPRGGGRGGAARGSARDAAAARRPRRIEPGWYASPYKVFDNFYWLGTRQHSSWALRTSEGIIIIDTNFAWATQPEIIDGLTDAGSRTRARSSTSSSATLTATTIRAPRSCSVATAPKW